VLLTIYSEAFLLKTSFTRALYDYYCYNTLIKISLRILPCKY